MIKNIALLATFALVSCSEKNSEKVSNIDSAISKLADSVYVSENKDFLDQFKTVSDTVLVFESPKDGTQPLRQSQWLKPDFLKFYPTALKIGNPRKPEVYALQKFEADRQNTCLITQNPGDFSLTSISLLLYNHQAEAVSGLLELADYRLEKGFMSQKKSVLVKSKNRILGLMKYVMKIEPVDAEDPTKPYSESAYYSVNIHNGKIDTAKATPAQIDQFKSYLK